MLLRVALRQLLPSFKPSPSSISVVLNRLYSSQKQKKKNSQSYQNQIKQKLKRGQKQQQTQQITEGMIKNIEMVQQTQNLEVASESVISEQVIIQHIKTQRQEIFGKHEESVENGKGQGDVKGVKNRTNQSILEEYARNTTLYNMRRVLMGITGLNLGIAGFLSTSIIANHLYWLGVYSAAMLYPSLLLVSSASVGINLAYLITRQALCMYKKTEKLKKIDITYSPPSYYLEMSLILLQIISLSAAVSMPITLLKLSPAFQNLGLYSMLVCLLSVNLHSTYMQKDIKNNKYKISIQSICFIILLVLSAYIHNKYWLSQASDELDDKNKTNFKQGEKKVKQMWSIKRVKISSEKITDILGIQVKNQSSGGEVDKKQGEGKIF